jgi:transposase InsO family protein
LLRREKFTIKAVLAKKATATLQGMRCEVCLDRHPAPVLRLDRNVSCAGRQRFRLPCLGTRRHGLVQAQALRGLIHHSDRGSQYASEVFQARLKEYGMACSMSRKGNCWDNAPTESWFGGFKNERVHGERIESHDEMKALAFEYIEVF